MQLFLNFMDGPGPLLCYNCQSHRCRSFHSITNSFLCPSKSTIQKKCDNFRSRVITFTFFLPSYCLNNHHLCVEIKSLFLISWQVEEETKNFLFIETHLAGVFLKENFKDTDSERSVCYTEAFLNTEVHKRMLLVLLGNGAEIVGHNADKCRAVVARHTNLQLLSSSLNSQR